MPIRRKIVSFLGKSIADQFMVCEAIVFLALSRLAVVTLPFRIIVSWVSRAPDGGVADPLLLARVRQAVTTAARNVPWNAVCLPQAMAAKAMLARRGQGSAFHLGATLDDKSKLSAHAWLVVGDTIVVGAAGIPGMSPLARFG
jgi:Transglutaminase-like superfamily